MVKEDDALAASAEEIDFTESNEKRKQELKSCFMQFGTRVLLPGAVAFGTGLACMRAMRDRITSWSLLDRICHEALFWLILVFCVSSIMTFGGLLATPWKRLAGTLHR